MSSGNVSATEDVSVSAVPLRPGAAVTGVEATGHSRGYRNAALCAVLVAVCLWIAWPVSKMGFLDDWSYARTAQIYAQTGHFVYNGWATAMLGWQIVWGALFIKLFGFSFTILRVSMLPIAMATVFLFHQMLLRFGVSSRNAVIGTLTLGLSPLFLPLADSFMTDIPGLLVILICIYCCQRAIASGSTRSAILWLVLAAASNVGGGTVRQIAWLGALVVVPTTGWILRRRRGVLPVSVAMWAASVATIFGCMKWFARQPYSISESAFGLFATAKLWALFFIPRDVAGSGLLSLLVLYPIVVPWLSKARHLNAAAVRMLVFAFAICEALQYAFRMSLPWLRSNLILAEFAPHRSAGAQNPDRFLLPPWGSFVLGAVVTVTGLLLLANIVQDRARRSEAGATGKGPAQHAYELLLPYTISYFLLLCPRASVGFLFDRYLLGVMPVFIVWLLLYHQRRVADRLPRASIACLAVLALLGIAGTHDWFAWQRARGAAIDEVLASGVPATDIQGGFEADGWTQIQDGHLNNRRIVTPANAYVKPADGLHPSAECTSDFAEYTPAIRPVYAIGFDREPCFSPTKYPPVAYRRWLPPFQDTVSVQRLTVR